VRLPASGTISAEEMLTLGNLDFVVNTTPMQDERIEWRPLMRDEYLLMVPEQMPYETGAIVNLDAFREEPFIMPQSGSESRQQIEFFCNLAGFTPNIAFEVTENEMTRKLVQFGYGVAFIPGLSAANTIEIPPEAMAAGLGRVNVKFLRIQTPHCYRTIGINHMKNQKFSTSAELLLNHFVEFFRGAQKRSDQAFPTL
jgi:DNA-binding transcriptional LysR family regulator